MYENIIRCLVHDAIKINYKDAFELIYDSQIELFDKYIILIILAYYHLSDNWRFLEESCRVNYPDITIMDDHHVYYLMWHYCKGLRRSDLDHIIYEGVRIICLNNRSVEFKKLVQLSETLNYSIKIRMYQNNLQVKCREKNLNEIADLIDGYYPKKCIQKESDN